MAGGVDGGSAQVGRACLPGSAKVICDFRLAPVRRWTYMATPWIGIIFRRPRRRRPWHWHWVPSCQGRHRLFPAFHVPAQISLFPKVAVHSIPAVPELIEDGGTRARSATWKDSPLAVRVRSGSRSRVSSSCIMGTLPLLGSVKRRYVNSSVPAWGLWPNQ